jgi:DNA recombination protein RmuC
MKEIVLILIGILTGAVLFYAILIRFFRLETQKEKTIDEKMAEFERRIIEALERSKETLGERFERTSIMMQERVREFTEGITSMKAELSKMNEHVKEISSVQDLFKSPKLRGQWGEETLIHILSQHYPKELYEIQYEFRSGEKVDAVLKLPNGTLAPIDAKFPLENFSSYIESVSPQEKENSKKNFIQAVKSHIDTISRKYILPGEGTTDYALMYVPAEAVYYEIIFGIGKDAGLPEYARARKIIIVSPNTLFMALRTIEHWYKDISVERKTKEILQKIEKILHHAEKLSDDFEKLGKHLQNATSSYAASEKRLNLMKEDAEKLLISPQNSLDLPRD